MADPRGAQGRIWFTPGGRELAKKRHPASSKRTLTVVCTLHNYPDRNECPTCIHNGEQAWEER